MSDETENPQREEILSPEETEALLQGIEDGSIATSQGHGRPDAEVRLYDFSDCERLARGSMPTLGIINTRIARKLQESISELLRKPVEVEVAEGRLERFGEHMATLTTPAILNLVRLRPLAGSILIVPTHKLISLCVDCFFGGQGAVAEDIPVRELTTVEQRLVSLLLERFLGAFSAGWEPVLEIEPEIIGQEQNPHFAAIANSGDRIIVTEFTINVGQCAAALQLLVPRAVLEPVSEALDAAPRGDEDEASDAQWQQSLHERFQLASLDLSAKLTETRLRLGDVLALQPGDVIPVELPDQIVLEAAGTPLFTGRAGCARRRNALEVIAAVAPASRDLQRNSND